MFDFHMHSLVSGDSQASPEEMVAAAEAAGLKEICFTDHMDCKIGLKETNVFTQESYQKAYENLRSEKVVIRFGMEFGMMMNNRERFLQEVAKRDYDFIIGSLHNIGSCNVYYQSFNEGKTQEQVYAYYLESVLECLEVHRDFHVLGHMTFPTKAAKNPEHTPYTMEKYGDLAEEIFKKLTTMGIGLEVNTSGIKSSGQPIPPLDFVKRYVEMGGEIITIGSDAHKPEQVGNYVFETLQRLKEITPWICTFAEGKPKFHRIDSLC